MTQHSYLIYGDSPVPLIESKKLACYIINRYCGTNWSITKFQKLKTIELNHKEKKLDSVSIRFNDLVNHILEERTFDPGNFSLPPLASNLLDSTSIQLNAPAIGMKFQFDTGIPNFPIKPVLASEGIIFNSFQSAIQKNILRLHKILVNESHKIMDDSHYEWISNLRMLLNETVSLVDVTLFQLFYRAKYSPKPHWSFDEDKIVNRPGGRILDKLKWVGKITGKSLDDAQNEIKSFTKVKNIRNHLNHFDPPCVVISIDDAAEWLNLISDIGRLIWKIRSRLDSQLTTNIIEIILLKNVIINPKFKRDDRIRQNKNEGYSSCLS